MASDSIQFSSNAQLCLTLWPHESQHARPHCHSPTPEVHSHSCPLSRWCHPAISSYVVSFFSCPQSLSASGSIPMSELFAWGGQSIRVSASASVLPMSTQDWSPLAWTDLLFLNIHVFEDLTCNMTIFGDGNLREVIRIRRSHEGGTPMMELVAL